jgi:hypothetical protein
LNRTSLTFVDFVTYREGSYHSSGSYDACYFGATKFYKHNAAYDTQHTTLTCWNSAGHPMRNAAAGCLWSTGQCQLQLHLHRWASAEHSRVINKGIYISQPRSCGTEIYYYRRPDIISWDFDSSTSSARYKGTNTMASQANNIAMSELVPQRNLESQPPYEVHSSVSSVSGISGSTTPAQMEHADAISPAPGPNEKSARTHVNDAVGADDTERLNESITVSDRTPEMIHKQLKKSSMKLVSRFIIDLVLWASFILAVVYTEQLGSLSRMKKHLFNAVGVGLPLMLGLNYNSSFQAMAGIMRWRILASAKFTLKEVCDFSCCCLAQGVFSDQVGVEVATKADDW